MNQRVKLVTEAFELSAFVLMSGIVLVTKPPFLFNNNSNSSNMNNSNESGKVEPECFAENYFSRTHLRSNFRGKAS